MNAFFDLMYVYYLMASICAFHFIKAILACPLERGKSIGCSFLSALVVVFIYPDPVWGYLFSLLYWALLLFVFFRKRALRYFPLFVLFLTFVNVLNLFCYPDFLTVRNGILVISAVAGAWSFLSFPVLYLAVTLVTKAVDSLYRLRNYKTVVLLGSGEKRKEVTAYFDSGNTLRYRNCPVIFLRSGIFEFTGEERVEGDILQTLGRLYGVKKLYRTLVRLNAGPDSYFVYVAVKDDSRKYNGCDALLNLYLGG